MSLLPVPGLTHVFDLTVQVAAPIEVGETGAGLRRVIPITGGELTGPGLRGQVLAAGADFQLVGPGGLSTLDARYVIELEGGARLYVVNTALRSGPPELMARLVRGEPVDPAQIYFRCTPRFEVAEPALAWLRERVFIGSGARRPDRVELSVWQVD